MPKLKRVKINSPVFNLIDCDGCCDGCWYHENKVNCLSEEYDDTARCFEDGVYYIFVEENTP